MRRTFTSAAALLGTLLTFFIALGPTPSAGQNLSRRQTTLYGGVGRGPGSARGTLLTLGQKDGAGTLVGEGAADTQVGITGLAFDTSGDLFATTIDDVVFGGAPVTTLIRLDPVAGTQLSSLGVVRLADGTPVVVTDLALQPGTDVLFGTALNLATGSSQIYTIDKATAVATFVGATGVLGATLAFAPDGTLYQTSAEFTAQGAFIRGFLNTLDPGTAAVLSTSAPFTEAHIGGLAVRPTDGLVFASGGSSGDIYTLSPGGGLTFLGLTGFGGMGDIAFTPLPTSEADCKDGGWQNFNFPFGFRNQGDCIQFAIVGK